MREARVAAQAKVNLRLRILQRQPDGFHQLETLFLRIALADEVVVRVDVPGRALTVAGEEMPPAGLGAAEENLGYRAALAYAAESGGWPDGFGIEIRKRIPVGGGLGGGSADAAAVLRALDALAPEPLGDRLLAVAARLGSDVPFLASEHAYAIGRGRGERLEPLVSPPRAAILLVIPPFGVNTAAAYRWLAESRASGATAIHNDAPLDSSSLSTWAGIAAVAANDFQPIVVAREPGIGTAVEALRRTNALIAMMSGSGSTVFGVYPRGLGSAPALPAEFRVIETASIRAPAPVRIV